MSSSRPRVSIGLPVFQGAKYLRDALDSIVAQTYGDFELLISDNGSTDETEDIVRSYAARDRRIRYARHGQNIGAAKNLNHVFQLATGEYFRWAAHDDILAPDCLAKCVEVLDGDRSVVLCHSRAKVIDERGSVIEEYAPPSPMRTDSPHASDRFLDLINVSHRCYEVFGLVRAAALRQTSLHGSYPISDRVLLMRLSLFGRFHELPEFLFFPRRHAEQSSQEANRYARTVWCDPTAAGKIIFPKWRIFAGFWATVPGTPLSWTDRVRCYRHLVRWTAHNSPALVRDLTEAGKILLLRSGAVRGLVAAAKHR
jgi:glycosyltransferase involved in cell wall biosynthesis